MAALPPSAAPLLPTAAVPLTVRPGCPTDTGELCSLARHGAAGLGVEAELLEPCPQHLHCFLSLALHGLSKQLCMARGMDPPSEHGQHERESSHVPGTSSALLLLLAGRSGTMPLEQAGFGDPDGGMCPGETGQQGGFCRNFSFPGRGPASKDLCEGKGER